MAEKTKKRPARTSSEVRDDYLRKRIAPRTLDPLYLHLSDLLLALQAHASNKALRILDFGAGISPYRSLFPKANYQTADLEGANTDFRVDGDGYTDAPDHAYDLVLSTQVLEHCRNPDRHLAEVRRVLKQDGQLILSTHGLFEEHAYPLDFFRWTAEGLRMVVERNDFTVDSMARLTAGPRAAFHLMQRALSQELLDRKPLRSRLLWRPVLRFLLARRFWNAVLDRTFAEYRVLTSRDLSLANTYVALLVVAKPNT